MTEFDALVPTQSCDGPAGVGAFRDIAVVAAVTVTVVDMYCNRVAQCDHGNDRRCGPTSVSLLKVLDSKSRCDPIYEHNLVFFINLFFLIIIG